MSRDELMILETSPRGCARRVDAAGTAMTRSSSSTEHDRDASSRDDRDEQAPNRRSRPTRLVADGRSAADAAGAEPPSDSLLIDDLDRYSRLRLISWWRQERLRDGAGAGRRRGRAGQRGHEEPGAPGPGHDLPDRPGRRRAVEPVAVGAVPRRRRRPAQGRGRRAARPRAQPRDQRSSRFTAT